MKRLIILFVLLALMVSLLPQQHSDDIVIFEQMPVTPTTLIPYSAYDYSHGAYDGYPLRIPFNIADQPNAGIYMTYMGQPTGWQRRQYWAWANMEGGQFTTELLTHYAQHREGFGTLALDPRTNNPFYAWHNIAYHIPPQHNDNTPLDTSFLWDVYHEYKSPGLAMTQLATLSANHLNHENERFIWPVVYFGPSPYAGNSRVYVFHSNSGRSKQLQKGSTSDYIPASNVLITYADVNLDTYGGQADELVWVERKAEYLEQMFNWVPENNGEDVARALFSYAVSPHSGHVVLGGEVYTNNTEEWSGLPLHDHAVLVHSNYLEGNDLVIPFEVYHRILENVHTDPPNLLFNPDDRATASGDVLEWVEMWEGEDIFLETPPVKITQLGMVTAGLSKRNLAIDRWGRVHVPIMFNMMWTDESTEVGYYSWYRYGFSVHVLRVDLVENPDTWHISHIDPHHTFSNDHIPHIWDLDSDGYVDFVDDVDTLRNRGWLFYKPVLPMFHPETDEMFHTMHLRLTQDNDGLMAMMWMDCKFAGMHDQNDTVFPEYKEVPEIMIAVSNDSGSTWSKPSSISTLTHNLGTIPAYVFPADKMFYPDPMNNNVGRLFFMYTDDLSWGTFSGGETPIGVEGALVKFAAVDIQFTRNNEVDDPKLKPVSHLSQNYPNPFNPTTSIRFNVPVAGNAKIDIYNVKGQHIKTLVDDNFTAGSHTTVWNGEDSNNRATASGVYFYRLQTNGLTETKRMVLMK